MYVHVKYVKEKIIIKNLGSSDLWEKYYRYFRYDNEEAFNFFENIPQIENKFHVLMDVGLVI